METEWAEGEGYFLGSAESDIDSTGAELWSLRDWPPQSSKFRWIKFYEQDSSEWSNSYSDGIPKSFKSYGQRQQKDE